MPGIYNKHFKNSNDFYKNIKSLLVVHSNNQYAEISREELMKANLDIHPSLKGDVLNIFEVAVFETDFIVILDTPSNQISSDLLKLDSFKTNSNKISVLNIENEEKPNYHKISEQIDKINSEIIINSY